MSYRVVGKIELDREHTLNPGNNKIVRQKVGLDLKIYDENGELDNDEVIEQGFAYKARFGFLNSAGEEVILFEGKGASGERYPEEGGPENGRHAGCSIPNPDYIERGSGISAILDSNGLRMYPNFKKLPDDCYTAFAEVEGAGKAQFKHGDTFCTGRSKPGRGHAS